MTKSYLSLGLMSGTSGDGIDASLIKSNGSLNENNSYEVIVNKYFEYDEVIFKKIYVLRNKVNTIKDLKTHSNEIKEVERLITIFHAKVVDTFSKKYQIDLIGFHGHTIFHNPDKKITKQIGNAKLLSQLTKKNIIFDFRSNDIKNGGQGAPLAPLFHLALSKKNKITPPWVILNIGGISNITFCGKNSNDYRAMDIGPGNCLIDNWIRINTSFKFDENGIIASRGTINKQILQDNLESEQFKPTNSSYDINDFDLGFVRGLSTEDGAATLTEYTSELISWKINSFLKKKFENVKLSNKIKLIITGGGRKNKFLVERLKKKTNCEINPIEKYNLDGDFIESQAFAFLAIRSFVNQPISYRWMTGCKKNECKGGKLIIFK